MASTVSPLTSLGVTRKQARASACTATIQRQLTTNTTGVISYNYIAQQGLGLQLMLQRQLFAQTRGHDVERGTGGIDVDRGARVR